MQHAMRKRIQRTKDEMLRNREFNDAMLSPTGQNMKRAFLKKIEDRRRQELERQKTEHEFNRQATQKSFM